MTVPANRVLLWLLLLCALGFLVYLSFGAYMTPELLVGFANFYICH